MTDERSIILRWIFTGRPGINRNSQVYNWESEEVLELIKEGMLKYNGDGDWLDPTPACVLAYGKGKPQ